MAAAIGALDETIKEYLLYRGFTLTLKNFEQEKKDDKDKGLRVNRIVDHLLQCVYRSDFASLQGFWIHLNKRFFSRLTSDSLNTAYRLETNILRLFLVHASKQGRQDEIKAFYEKMSDALHDRKEWKDWFALPFTKNPDQHSTFKMYYSKEWMDAFIVTLHNFFSTLFTCLPLPALLNFEAEHQKMQALATENHHLHNQLAATKQALAEAESTVQKLEAKLANQMALQATATAAASKRRAVATGKVSKPSKLVPGPTKKKASSFSVASPIKSSDEKADQTPTPSATATPLKEAIDEQTQSPTHSKRQLHFSDLPEESNLDLASPASVVDEGCVKTHTDTDGNTPFLPVSQESYRSHSAPITHCKFSPNATQVASADTDGVLRIWEPSSLVTSATIELKSSLLSLDWVSQLDSLVLVGSGGGVIKLFDSSSSKFHWEIASDPKYPKILSIACSPSSSTFAFSAVASPGTSQQSSSHKLTFGLTSPSLPSHRAVPSQNQTSEMQMLRRSGEVGETPVPGGVFLWDLKTQKQKCSLPLLPHPVGINCMAFNHNSNLLVTGGADGMIRMFDVFQEECLFGWMGHEWEVYNVQFSSDETSVYSMGMDGKFSQWSVMKSGEKVTEFDVHEDACRPWSQGSGPYYPSTPRGNLFAFESEDKFVLTCAPQQAIVYQVSSEGSLTKTLSITGHNGPVSCVDWLQGRRSYSTCITGSLDCCIRVTNLLKNS